MDSSFSLLAWSSCTTGHGGLVWAQLLGYHVLCDGSEGIEQLRLQPGLHDQQVHMDLEEEGQAVRDSGNERKIGLKLENTTAPMSLI